MNQRARTSHRRPDHETYEIVIYVDQNGVRPVEKFLDACPVAVEARVAAVATAVAEAPPHRFAGGGMWEAMHGEMKGWYEIRLDHQRLHYRVFCLLDSEADGHGPLLVLVDGRQKRRGMKLSTREYTSIRRHGERYWSLQPRPIA